MEQNVMENGATGTIRDYRIRLDEFEGPLDLLLHLIKKNELDISKISIAIITEQYLKYIDMMKELNLEIAGEFLVMAATLAQLKSKSLLPPEEDVIEAEEEDEFGSQEDLVRRLQEYQRFKDAAEELGELPRLDRDFFIRESSNMETVPNDELRPVSLFSLVDLFYKRLQKRPKILAHEVEMERISVAQRIQEIISMIDAHDDKTMDFEELLDDINTNHDIIVTFLALLEMSRVNLIKILQAVGFGRIIVQRSQS